MLPKFPIFKKIELSDEKDIQEYTAKYNPYSDFNFAIMWSWDVNQQFSVSELNGNLVVVLTDHFTDTPFYSFLGNNQVNETLSILFHHAKESGNASESDLRLVPEVVLKDIDFSKFIIEIDLNNYDYIYSTEDLSSYEGSKYATKRKLFGRFVRKYIDHRVEVLDLTNSDIRRQIIDFSMEWAKNKTLHEEGLNLDKESVALKRFLEASFKNIMAVGIFVGEKLIGYQLCELLPNDYSICHFGKTDVNYAGAFEYMMSVTSSILLQKNVKLLNTEEDLGLPQLRYAKNSYRPVDFLRKYTIKKL